MNKSRLISRFLWRSWESNTWVPEYKKCLLVPTLLVKDIFHCLVPMFFQHILYFAISCWKPLKDRAFFLFKLWPNHEVHEPWIKGKKNEIHSFEVSNFLNAKFYFPVLKIVFYSLTALVIKILFSLLENKIHIHHLPNTVMVWSWNTVATNPTRQEENTTTVLTKMNLICFLLTINNNSEWFQTKSKSFLPCTLSLRNAICPQYKKHYPAKNFSQHQSRMFFVLKNDLIEEG